MRQRHEMQERSPTFLWGKEEKLHRGGIVLAET